MKINSRKALFIITLVMLLSFLAFWMPGCGGGGGGTVSSGGGGGGDTGGSLEQATTYNWQVEAVDSEGNTSDSEVWSFTTEGRNSYVEGPVDRNLAYYVAKTLVERERNRAEVVRKNSDVFAKIPKDPIESMNKLFDEQGHFLAYVFDLNPTGYVVVPSNAALPPVIAYSFRTEFSWEDTPENMLYQILKQDLTMRFRAKREVGLKKSAREKATRQWEQFLTRNFGIKKNQRTQYGPLFTFSTWDQSSPYNDLCPEDPDTSDRSVVGHKSNIPGFRKGWHFSLCQKNLPLPNSRMP
ncbi:MAG: Spi family protease inhibitor, partial [Vulcanimicrobiota bacterium]